MSHWLSHRMSMSLRITHSVSWISLSSSLKWTEIAPVASQDYGPGYRYQGRDTVNLHQPFVSKGKDQISIRTFSILGRVSKMSQLSSQLISQNCFRDTIVSQAPRPPAVWPISGTHEPAYLVQLCSSFLVSVLFSVPPIISQHYSIFSHPWSLSQVCF